MAGGGKAERRKTRPWCTLYSINKNLMVQIISYLSYLFTVLFNAGDAGRKETFYKR